MFNKTLLVGRMTRDPELRKTQNGNAVASFTLALDRNYESKDGVQADYIPCVVWNKSAENVCRFCNKGSLVGVDGRLQSRSYENANGQKVFVVEVICERVQFIETKKSQNDSSNNTQSSSHEQHSEQNQNMNSFSFEDFDIGM